MASHAARKAAQQAKVAAMPLVRRIAVVISGSVASIVTCVVVNLLLSGEAKFGLSLAVGVAMTLMLGYQYLVAPSQR